MRSATLSVVLAVLFSAEASHSAEMSVGTNFTVLAPNQAVADAIATQAELYRKQAALEWLGKALPDRVGRSLITVDLTSEKDEGLTWPIDCRERTLHQVWLTTSVDRALGATLHHEVIHTVLDSYSYPEALPVWASEGIASQADDSNRKENQRRIVAGWSKDGHWPSLRSLFESSRIAHDNLNGYAAASSVIDFLAQRGGKARVVEFVSSGQKGGWDQAASHYYGVQNLGALQAAWQDWATKKVNN
jgi:hypothetical protein